MNSGWLTMWKEELGFYRGDPVSCSMGCLLPSWDLCRHEFKELLALCDFHSPADLWVWLWKMQGWTFSASPPSAPPLKKSLCPSKKGKRWGFSAPTQSFEVNFYSSLYLMEDLSKTSDRFFLKVFFFILSGFGKLHLIIAENFRIF